MTVALRQIFWDFTSFQTGRHILTQPLGFSVPCMQRNSGWISSGPGALPAFIDLSAFTSSYVVKGINMFTSLLTTFHSSATSFPTCLEKSRSGLVKRPFWSSCDAIALALTGNLSGVDAVSTCGAVDSVPSFSAGVCEVNRFHCLNPTFLAFLIQALDQKNSCGFRLLT